MNLLWRIIRSVLPYLPAPLRSWIIQKRIVLPVNVSDSFTFKVASEISEFEAAAKLVYSVYSQTGYCSPNPLGIRLTIHHGLPSTSVLIAKHEGQVVGTLTVVRDNLIGLPLEKCFSLDEQRSSGLRIAEITSLVIDPKYRRKSGGLVLFPLLKLMYEYCTDYFGTDMLVVAVHPREKAFYESLLLFDEIGNGEAKDYLGAPAIAMKLNLVEALKLYKEVYSGKAQNRDLFRFFVQTSMNSIEFPERSYFRVNDPVVSESYFDRIFVKKLNLEKNLDAVTIERIRGLMGNMLSMNRPPRFEVKCKVRVFDVKLNSFIGGFALDASLRGLRLRLDSDLQFLDEVIVQVQIAKDQFTRLRCRRAWSNPESGHGFSIESFDPGWAEFIKYLESASLPSHSVKRSA